MLTIRANCFGGDTDALSDVRMAELERVLRTPLLRMITNRTVVLRARGRFCATLIPRFRIYRGLARGRRLAGQRVFPRSVTRQGDNESRYLLRQKGFSREVKLLRWIASLSHCVQSRLRVRGFLGTKAERVWQLSFWAGHEKTNFLNDDGELVVMAGQLGLYLLKSAP